MFKHITAESSACIPTSTPAFIATEDSYSAGTRESRSTGIARKCVRRHVLMVLDALRVRTRHTLSSRRQRNGDFRNGRCSETLVRSNRCGHAGAKSVLFTRQQGHDDWQSHYRHRGCRNERRVETMRSVDPVPVCGHRCTRLVGRRSSCLFGRSSGNVRVWISIAQDFNFNFIFFLRLDPLSHEWGSQLYAFLNCQVLLKCRRTQLNMHFFFFFWFSYVRRLW